MIIKNICQLSPGGGENHPWLKTLRGKADSVQIDQQRRSLSRRRKVRLKVACAGRRPLSSGEKRPRQEQTPGAGLQEQQAWRVISEESQHLLPHIWKRWPRSPCGLHLHQPFPQPGRCLYPLRTLSFEWHLLQSALRKVWIPL